MAIGAQALESAVGSSGRDPRMDASNTQVLDLCARLAVLLSKAGAPAHRLERAIDVVLAASGRSGAVVASPTAVWLQVEAHGRVLRVDPGEVELAVLTRLLRLVDRIDEGLSVPDGLAALRRLERAGEPWPVAAERAAFVFTSVVAAVLLGGGVADLVASAVAGGVALVLLPRLGRGSAWHPLRDLLLAGVLGGLGAVAAVFGASPMIVALSGAILVVPGLSLTTGIAEAAAGHWSSGSARLLGAGVSLVQLAAGGSLGWWLVGDLAPLWGAGVVPGLVVELAPLFAPALFAVLLRARPQDLPVIWLTAVLGWSVAEGVDGLAGAFAAATTIGAAARLLGRLSRVPDLVLVLPGVLLLVPGAVGVHGVDQLLALDVDGGMTTAVGALQVAGALAGGLFAGQALAMRMDCAIRTSTAARQPGAEVT